jgi:hypothetical protein
MPSIDIHYTQSGPLLKIFLGVSVQYRTTLEREGVPIPGHVAGTFLIDTGAAGTCVDPAILEPLGLEPTGALFIETPSTGGKPHFCRQYDVLLMVPPVNPGDAPLVVDALPVVETSVRPQGIDGLIGRDVLQRCILICNGPIGLMTLAY